MTVFQTFSEGLEKNIINWLYGDNYPNSIIYNTTTNEGLFQFILVSKGYTKYPINN